MRELEVYVNKSSFHLSKLFELLLKSLSNVVSLLQSHVLWQNNVHLHRVVRPKSVGSYCVDIIAAEGSIHQ